MHGGLPADVALRWSIEGWDIGKRRDVVVPDVSRVKRSGGGAYDPEDAPMQQFRCVCVCARACVCVELGVGVCCVYAFRSARTLCVCVCSRA